MSVGARTTTAALAGLCAAAALAQPGIAQAASPVTARVSVATGGAQADKSSGSPAISANGRFVAFGSNATNLVPGDTNGVFDIFLRDTVSGATTLVSAGIGGDPANAGSTSPRISANGRFVVYSSEASNIVAGDTNGQLDVFVYDRVAHTTVEVPAGAAGATDGDVSSNGRFVSFATYSALVAQDKNGSTSDVYVYDTTTKATSLISHNTAGRASSGTSFDAAISDDGNVVAYKSSGGDLAPQPGINWDVYVYDRKAGTTVRASNGTDGWGGDGSSSSPQVSANGRWITFESSATSLVAGDTNNASDVFLFDRQAKALTLASATPGGASGNSDSMQPAISGNGRYVSYWSVADDLVAQHPGGFEPQVLVYDRQTKANTLVSVPESGTGGGGWRSALNGDGRVVAYESDADDLVAGDTNDAQDIFRTQLP